MKRYKAYDPPEYVGFTVDAEALADFHQTATSSSDGRERYLDRLTVDDILALYRDLVMARLFDIQLQRWVKQGVISKAWLATGEEAATVGAVHALRENDVVGPMIRNAAACIQKGMSLESMFSAYLATRDNPTQGRDLHTGTLEKNILTPISHVAALVPVVAGAALAFKLDGEEDRIALTWAGDGSTRCGEFHEGLNLAAVYRVPAIFVVQNNQVALGTHRSVHTRGPLSGLAEAYGLPCIEVDGNNVVDVWAATAWARDIAVSGDGPVMMVSHTFRMGGHATHDQREARSLFGTDVFAHWGKRDPIGLFEAWATQHRDIDTSALAEIEARALAAMDSAAERAVTDRASKGPNPDLVTHGVFAP